MEVGDRHCLAGVARPPRVGASHQHERYGPEESRILGNGVLPVRQAGQGWTGLTPDRTVTRDESMVDGLATVLSCAWLALLGANF